MSAYGGFDYARFERVLREELKASRFYSRFGIRTILPDQKGVRSCEIHAMMPFNDKLYVATGYGGGLYSINEDFSIALEKTWSGSRNNFARMWHKERNLAIVGNFIVTEDGKVTDVIEKIGFGPFSAAVAYDLSDPENYVVSITGTTLYRVNLDTLSVVKLADIGTRVKDMYTKYGKVWIVSQDYYPPGTGGLYVWDGSTLTKVRSGMFYALWSSPEYPLCPLIAVGRDALSAILDVTRDGSTWTRYRLPIAMPNYDIPELRWVVRLVSSFRPLAFIAGMWYELRFWYGYVGGDLGTVPFIPVPIARSLWTVFDFCGFMGFLAVGRSESYPPEHHTGQPQSGIDFVPMEALWSFGKPRGYGAVWKDTSVNAGEYSDPFLVYGFDRKTFHLWTDTAGAFTIEVDPLGDGSWKTYDTISLSAGEYTAYIMTGDAVWVRFSFDKAAKVGAVIVVG